MELSSQDRFVAFMRHELRTPISAMLGYAELMLDEAEEEDSGVSDDIKLQLRNIAVCARELVTLVSDLLDPARRVCRDNIASCVAELRHAVRTPIDTILGYTELLLEELEARPALGFLEDAANIDQASRQLYSKLEDIVRLYHARAGVLDPSAIADTLPSGVLDLRAMRGQGRRDGRVLVVDDEDASRDLSCRRLRKLGHEALAASSGEQALEMLREDGAIDLVLLDVLMPDMNGIEVLAHMKESADLRDIPVIVVSALDEMASVTMCIKAGAADHLPKPVEPVILRARVDACIEWKRMRDKELAYLRAVAQVTDAARAVEERRFEPDSLADVHARPDALGSLARVFVAMAREVRLREERLEQEVQLLRIEIDEHRRQEQVAEITGTDFFHKLESRARARRARRGRRGST